jgi:abhydrolase domain-containing protein 17
MNKQILKRLLVGEWSFRRLIQSLFLIYAVVCLYVFLTADAKIFLPQPASYQDNSEIIKITTPDQIQLSAVYRQNPAAIYTILYAHGNAEDLGDIEPLLQKLPGLGFNIFAYDYRGYGTSQGKPTEGHAYQDIETVYNYLTKQLSIPSQRIIAYGRSVGSGSTVDLASHKPLAGLILESAFTSAFRVVVPFPIFPFDKFPNLDKIKKVKCPVLVMHGKADDTIPLSHGQQLYAAVKSPKISLWVDEAGHNDLMWVADKRYGEILRQFVKLIQSQEKTP